jgi:hypothetical protein
VTTFREYKVEKTPAILKATLKKLFELRGGDSNHA